MNLGSINTGLLRFCMQLDDGPSQGTKSEMPTRNPEEMQWLRNVLDSLKSDADRIKCCVANFSKPDALPDDILSALDELRFLIEDLDNANDYAKMGMGELVPLLSYGLDKNDVDQEKAVEIRSAAHWVISTAAQNNPFSQRLIVEQGVANIEVQKMEEEKDERVLAKCVGAVSAIVRDREEYLRELAASPVLDRLVRLVKESENIALLTRTVILLRHVVEGNAEVGKRLAQSQVIKSLSGRYASPLLQNGTVATVLSVREQILLLLRLLLSRDSSLVADLEADPSRPALALVLSRLSALPAAEADPFVTEIELLSEVLAFSSQSAPSL